MICYSIIDKTNNLILTLNAEGDKYSLPVIFKRLKDAEKYIEDCKQLKLCEPAVEDMQIRETIVTVLSAKG